MRYREYLRKKCRALGFLVRENLSSCSLAVGSEEDRREFSTHACECCSDTLAGARFKLTALRVSETLDYWVCWDCSFVLSYGDLDDMTAMDAEKGRESAYEDLREQLVSAVEQNNTKPETLKSALRDCEDQVWRLEETDAYMVEEINDSPIKLGETRLYGRRIASVDSPYTRLATYKMFSRQLSSTSEERCGACDQWFETDKALSFCPKCGALVPACDDCSDHDRCDRCEEGSMFKEFVKKER